MQPLQCLGHPLLPVPPIKRLDPPLQSIQSLCIRLVQKTLPQRQNLLQSPADRLEHTPVRIEHRLLCHIGDTHPLLHLHSPFISLFEARQYLQQGGLARAIAPDQSHPFLQFE